MRVLFRGGRRAAELDEGVGVAVAEGEGVDAVDDAREVRHDLVGGLHLEEACEARPGVVSGSKG